MAKASSPPTSVTQRRLNRKAFLILGVVLVVGLIAFFPITWWNNARTRQSGLAQAQAAEKAGNVDLALRHMERYVAAWPSDLPGLRYQAKLLADTARDDRLLVAAQANDKVLRLDPDGPDSQETRRRLIRLYVQYSDRVRMLTILRKEKGEESQDLRYRAAEAIARQLIADGAKDADAHLLLASALQGSAVGTDNKTRDPKALDQAIDEYRQAIALDPKSVVAARNLARLQFSQKKDPAAAEATMDGLLKAAPDSVDARIARYTYYTEAKNDAKALAEIEAAAKSAPQNVVVQSEAASDAIRRRNFDRARQYIDAIPVTPANELRIRTLRGSLEITEQHPDEAIEEWRKGLVAVEGTDVGLTWQLAYALIQLGRLNEARPLVSQFQRLAGEPGEPMARFLRAQYELRSGHPASAIKDLSRLADQIDPSMSPDVYFALGRSYEALGDESQAMVAYRQMAKLRPAAAEPRRAISRLLATKNPVDAINEMERALAQNPNDIALLVEVGRLRLRQQVILPTDQRRWEGVNAVIDHALQLDPDNFAAQAIRADVLAASNRLPEALAILRHALDGPGKKKLEIWVTYIGALDRLNQRDEVLKQVELASSPEAAGDRGSLRILRARVLVQLGQGQAARDALAKDRDKVPVSDRPLLAQALSELCRELGDRDGARVALVDWSKQSPDSADPGLNLISFAQTYNDDEAARLGLEALHALGGDQEPYGQAAQALELLRIGQVRANSTELIVATDPAELKRLDEADRLVTQLNTEAPQLAIVPTLQGLILERRGKLSEAIEAYRRAVKDAVNSPAVPRLVELLSRLKRFDEIDRLKARFEAKATANGTPAIVSTFDQISAAVAVKLGDDQRAELSVAELVQAQPENLAIRVSQAKLLVKLGKIKEAEATLRQLTRLRPAEAAPWLTLVQFRTQHRELGDITKLVGEVQAGYKGPRPELLLAKAYSQAGDKAAAIKLYDAALAQNGNDLAALREAIEFDDGNNRPKEAEAKLRKAIAIEPKTSWASRTLALILSNRPDRATWDEAWALIKPGSPGAGEAPEDRLVRATVLARSPDSEQREKAAPALVALARDLPASSPVAVEARVRLTQALLQTNKAAEAASMIAPIADDIDRPNASALAMSVEALVRSNDVSAARKRLEQLEAIEPKSSRTAASRAWVQQGSGKSDEATATLEAGYNEAEAAEGGESVALAFQNLAVKLGLNQVALKLAERIALKWPKDAYILARAQLAAGKVAEAIKSCQISLEAGEVNEAIVVATRIAIEKQSDIATLQVVDDLASAALAQAPKAPPVVIFVATLRHLQGRYNEEVDLYLQALATNPQRYDFLNNMAWTLSEGLQRYPEALERVDEAISRVGREASFLDTRGVILARLGRLKDAVADLEESVKVDQLANRSPSATTYFHLARTYRQLNNTSEYRRCRDMARKLKLDPTTLDPPDKADVASVMSE